MSFFCDEYIMFEELKDVKNKLNDKYNVISKLGEGTYGKVFLITELKSNKNYVVKQMKKMDDDQGISQTIIRELSILNKLNNKYIIKLIKCINNIDMFALFQHCQMDLAQYIHKYKTSVIPLSIIKKFTFQIINALHYLHKNKILHRDLKPQNILITHNNNIKVADFGLAREVSFTMTKLTVEVCTLWYKPPELLLGSKMYAIGIDIWSLGCIVGEMLKGKPLFNGNCEIGTLFKIFQLLGTPNEKDWKNITKLCNYQNIFPKFKKQNISNIFIQLTNDISGIHFVECLLQLNPITRWSAKRLLNHKWLMNNNINELNEYLTMADDIDMKLKNNNSDGKSSTKSLTESLSVSPITNNENRDTFNIKNSMQTNQGSLITVESNTTQLKPTLPIKSKPTIDKKPNLMDVTSKYNSDDNIALNQIRRNKKHHTKIE